MARLIMSGMEIGSSAARGVATQVGPYAIDGGTVNTNLDGAMETTIIRPGGGQYSLKMISAGAAAAITKFDTVAVWNIANTYFASMAFYFDVIPTAATTDIFAWSTNSGTNKVAILKITSGGKLRITDGTSAQIGADSGVTIATGTWYIFQSKIKTAAGAADDTIEARIIDTQSYSCETFVSSAVATLATITPQGGSYGILTNPTAAVNMYIDDFIVNDSTGTTNNDYPNPHEVIIALRPKSDNARTGWTAGAGATTNLWDAVNNAPPIGVVAATDTSQIKDSVSSATDNYDANTETYFDKGIGLYDVITAITAGANFGGGGAIMTGGISVVSNPAVTEVTDTTTNLIVGTWPSNWTGCWPVCIPVNFPSVTLTTAPVLRFGKRNASSTPLYADTGAIYVSVIKWPGTSKYTNSRLPDRYI